MRNPLLCFALPVLQRRYSVIGDNLMEYLEVKVTLGGTQDIGDYSNVKGSFTVRAKLTPTTEDQSDPFYGAIMAAKQQWYHFVDSELEAVGMRPRYFGEGLHCVSVSEVRNCVVLHHENEELPRDSNWQHTDRWKTHSAKRPFAARNEWVAKITNTRSEPARVDMVSQFPDTIPPLPDPGPAPAWHEKGLRTNLKNLQIKEDDWEKVAALDHVTADYLRMMYYNHNIERVCPYEDRLALLCDPDNIYLKASVAGAAEPEEDEPYLMPEDFFREEE